MFTKYKEALQLHFKSLVEGQSVLFVTDVDKDKMWDTYLNGFPEAERQEHNCSACRHFIKHYGSIVAIKDNKLVTMWQFASGLIIFDNISNELHRLVSTSPVKDIFVQKFATMGTDFNHENTETSGVITWHHMFCKLPNELVSKRNADTDDTVKAAYRDSRQVFKRSLDELTIDAVDTVMDMIKQNSLYRGEESKDTLAKFRTYQLEYKALRPDQKENYCWINANNNYVSRIRNTAMGTLLTNISEGMELDRAVAAFESIMAPANYKRPTPVLTKKMIEEAEQKIAELGYSESLDRRFAIKEDIIVGNTLFVDRNVKKATGVFSELKEGVTINPKTLSKMEEMNIDVFIANVLPKIDSLEVLLENTHQANLVSILTAVNAGAPSMFKWDNPFSWSYKDALTDSMKEKVKRAGGRVDGELRMSLEWSNFDDLDLHVVCPNRFEIYYGTKKDFTTGGTLDVDMNAGGGTTRTPVENIIFPDKATMIEGEYLVFVNQFAKRESIDYGFAVEIECNGQLFSFGYDKIVSGKIEVARVKYSKKNGIEVTSSLSTKTTSKEIWNLKTNQFHKVPLMMYSPNYWGGDGTGNKHIFFILEGAKSDESPRPFFNEFLKSELEKNKRVFEALGSKLKIEPADKQLSGLGFSSTNRNELIVRVTGSFSRTLKLKF